MNELCGDDTILACDASFSCGWAGSFFDVYGARRTILPRGAGGLGYAIPETQEPSLQTSITAVAPCGQ